MTTESTSLSPLFDTAVGEGGVCVGIVALESDPEEIEVVVEVLI